jgi:G3E family GTPase
LKVAEMFLFFSFFRQIALADVILLNKEDLVTAEELSELKNHIQYVLIFSK